MITKTLILFILSLTLAFGKDIYVSSSTGNDSNNGSIDAPLKTLSAIPKKDANIYLKSGDVFYEGLKNLENCKIDSYGGNIKPIICGLKILKNKNAWLKMPNDIWRLDLTNESDFEGFKTNNKQNNIGAIYDIGNDKIYGHLVRQFNSLNAENDFFVSSTNSDYNKISFKHLYFKTKNNLAKVDTKFAFVPYAFGVRNLKNCEVKNISIKGFGTHGISLAWNCKFKNIDIDLIGGSIQLGHKTWVRFGNGIEFWINDNTPCDNNIVENCKISRTYDCGVTIQGIGDSLKASNIVFRNNYFFRCRQAFEHFLHSKKDNPTYKNCEFSNNRCFEMGLNEFSSSEARDSNILSYERKPIRGLIIKNNVFWGASYYCHNSHTAQLENNSVYIYKNQYLMFENRNPENTLWAENSKDIEKMREKFGNISDKITLVSPDDKKLRDEILSEFFNEQKSEIRKKSPIKYRRDSFFRK